jgi:hypothetical protein
MEDGGSSILFVSQGIGTEKFKEKKKSNWKTALQLVHSD